MNGFVQFLQDINNRKRENHQRLYDLLKKYRYSRFSVSDFTLFSREMDKKYPPKTKPKHLSYGYIDFSREIDDEYSLDKNYGSVEYLTGQNIKLSKENEALRYRNKQLEDELQRITIDRNTLETLINLPFITKCDNINDIPCKRGVIYFIKEETSPIIKIGHTNNFSVRIKSLQTGNPRKLVPIGYILGAKDIEKRFHMFYERYRVEENSTEWYYNPPLRFE